MPETRLEDLGSGLTPVAEGWFVVNVRDAEWWFSDRRWARCAFESEYGGPPVEFAQLGINVTVLEPGQAGLYHAESNQEAFLVVSGECALLVGPVSEVAARHGASVAEETSDWRQAYATAERFRGERPPNWARLPWA